MPNKSDETRLFYLLSGEIPSKVIDEAFNTFGDVVNIQHVPGRNYGYVTFSKKQSAERCRSQLHGVAMYGQMIRVVNADIPGTELNPEVSTKRPRWN